MRNLNVEAEENGKKYEKNLKMKPKIRKLSYKFMGRGRKQRKKHERAIGI